MQKLRPDNQNLLELLKSASLFEDLELDSLQILASVAELYSCKRGEILFNAGDRAKGLYVVASGRVLVSRLGRDGPRADSARLRSR